MLRLRLSDTGGLAKPARTRSTTVVDRRRRRPTSSTPRSSPAKATEDERRIQRQALAGLLWTKQSYLFDVHAGSTATIRDIRRRPPAAIRNQHWRHLTRCG